MTEEWKRKRYRVVEFPGFVQNSDNAIKQLGGIENIDLAFNSSQALSMRPPMSSSFLHPLLGDVIDTGNLLFKVTVKRNKRTKQVVDSDVQIMGIVDKTARFRQLADYQYIPDENDSLTKLADSIHNWDFNGIEETQLTTDEGTVNPLRNFPPPSFLQIQWPLRYNYSPSGVVSRASVRKEDASESLQLVDRRATGRAAYYATINSKSNRADLSALKLNEKQKQEHAELVALFKKRPIYTKTAVISITGISSANLKILLPTIAYCHLKGPFRDCWIVYGYEPKEHPESYKYQLFEVRSHRADRPNYNRAPRIKGYQSVGAFVSGPRSRDAPTKSQGKGNSTAGASSSSSNSHMFFGEELFAAGHFQIVDIRHPKLAEIANRPSLRSSDYNSKTGWFKPRSMTRLRDYVWLIFDGDHSTGDTDMDFDFDNLPEKAGSNGEDEDEDEEEEEEENEYFDDQNMQEQDFMMDDVDEDEVDDAKGRLVMLGKDQIDPRAREFLTQIDDDLDPFGFYE